MGCLFGPSIPRPSSPTQAGGKGQAGSLRPRFRLPLALRGVRFPRYPISLFRGTISGMNPNIATDQAISMPNPPKIYAVRFAVRTYELDGRSRVRPSVLQNYIEEIATQGSASNGYGWDWYMANGHFWVARKISLLYGVPLTYGDEVIAETWVSDFKRVQSNREYILRRASDGALAVRARTNWVYVNIQAMRPVRIPEEFYDAFRPSEEVEDFLPPPPMHPIPAPMTYTATHPITTAEIDPAGHTNNAVYTSWSEALIDDALSRCDGLQHVPYTREIEYFRGARLGQRVMLSCTPTAYDSNAIAWVTEMHDPDGNLLVRDQAVRRFLTPPPEVLLELLSAPKDPSHRGE